jgi:hypothetical protein
LRQQPTDPEDAEIIPMPARRTRRVNRRVVAPVVELTPVIRKREQQKEIARIAGEMADLMTLGRKIRREMEGGPYDDRSRA